MKIHTQFLRTLVLMFMIGFSFQAFAGKNCNYHEAQILRNHYVLPNEVYLTPKGIFVLVEGNLYLVNTLCTDEKGVYVPSYEMSRELEWCPICQRWRDPDHICGNSR